MALQLLRSALPSAASGLRLATASVRRSSAAFSAEASAVSKAEPQQKYLPFHIHRTHTNNYPVYSDIKKGGTKIVTVLRRIEGDVKALQKELHDLLGPEVEIKEFVGRLEIKGRHVPALRKWLELLGF